MPRLIDLLRPLQRDRLVRLRRVMREGSPKFHYDVAALAAGVSADIDFETTFPLAKKYAPLDTCVVINNDAVDIGVRFNGVYSDLFIVPAGVIRSIGRNEVAAMWQARVTNLDAAIAVTAGAIDIEFSRSPEDADSVARRMEV